MPPTHRLCLLAGAVGRRHGASGLHCIERHHATALVYSHCNLVSALLDADSILQHNFIHDSVGFDSKPRDRTCYTRRAPCRTTLPLQAPHVESDRIGTQEASWSESFDSSKRQ